jgi:hypothetical protein
MADPSAPRTAAAPAVENRENAEQPMADDNPHRAAVDAWAAQLPPDLPVQRVIDAFDAAFGGLWQRGSETLGDITMTAISDRVLYTACRRFNVLKGVSTSPGGFQLAELRTRADGLDSTELLLAARFVLTEFLTVLGKLVAEILTPALHAELAKATNTQPAVERDRGS